MLEVLDKEKAVQAKDMIRTDANLQKMDKFLTREATEKIGVEAEEAMEEGEEEEDRREVELSSVLELRQEVATDCSPECRTILAGHTFVGCVDRRLALLQHSTRLYLTNTTTLSRHLFRQVRAPLTS